MRSTKFFIALGILLSACTIEPVEINYGMDACAFCTMTIVDRGHAAEYVSQKGKAYKFDAIECLARELQGSDDPAPALVLVADYSQPGKLLSAHEAIIVRCEDIPSPMGEFLSAFPDSASLKRIIGKGSYEILKWDEIEFER